MSIIFEVFHPEISGNDFKDILPENKQLTSVTSEVSNRKIDIDNKSLQS